VSAKRVEIGELQFATKRAATEYFREMLYRYQPGERVADDDAVALAELLRLHPEADEKRGPGVSYFFVQQSESWPTPCFWLHRVDGSVIEFSFRWCLQQQREERP
jgi:hypothetical protein